LLPLADQGRRADAGQHRVRGIDRAQLVLERVVGGVGDLGVPGVVAGPVFLEARGELVDAAAQRGIEVEAARGVVAVPGDDPPRPRAPRRRAAGSMSSICMARPAGNASAGKRRASRISSGFWGERAGGAMRALTTTVTAWKRGSRSGRE